jgi:hypothetical protein
MHYTGEFGFHRNSSNLSIPSFFFFLFYGYLSLFTIANHNVFQNVFTIWLVLDRTFSGCSAVRATDGFKFNSNILRAIFPRSISACLQTTKGISSGSTALS